MNECPGGQHVVDRQESDLVNWLDSDGDSDVSNFPHCKTECKGSFRRVLREAFSARARWVPGPAISAG
jgi:hypothetical protein